MRTRHTHIFYADRSCGQLISVHILSVMSNSRDENMVGNAVEPRDEDEENPENGVEMEDDINVPEVNEEEFQALNAQIDQLNVVLDALETKNDSIHAGLIELLQSNREARKQFKESQDNVQKKEEEAQS